MRSDRRVPRFVPPRPRWRHAALAVALAQAFGAAASDLPVACGAGCAAPFVSSGQIVGGAPVTVGNTMTIQQASERAILNWQSFDVGANHSVVFQQPSATAAVLNRVHGLDPSVIAGALRANGQVYLINQNGIVFDQGAQVSVGALLASTLNLRDDAFLNGILSANAGYVGTGLPPVLEGTAGAGNVSVRPGAVLTTPSGGRVMLFAPRVENGGRIETPDGQTILGGGRTVYLAASTDPAMRGLLIQVDGGNVPAQSTVTNTGEVSAPRGNVTLAALMVNQSGRASATTSVGANGSVYLVAGDTSRGGAASDFHLPSIPGFGKLSPNRGGTLTLSANSITAVLPESADTSTITDTQAFQKSSVRLVGRDVALEGNAQTGQGARILAPSGEVTITAGDDPAARLRTPGLFLGAAANTSRIYLDNGSRIDVSGVGYSGNAAGSAYAAPVALPGDRNFVEVRLTSNELADAPLQRQSVLRGQTITVDVRNGSTLTDIAPALANVGRSVLEKSVTGGTVRFESEGDVVLRAQSVVDVSGGRVVYGDTTLRASRLLGAEGRVYDVANAPVDIEYRGILDAQEVFTYTDPKWGVTRTWVLAGAGAASISPGYEAGASAGSITVIAPQLALRGEMRGFVSTGPYQRSLDALPAGGALVIGDAAGLGAAGALKDLRAGAVRLVDATQDLDAVFTRSSLLPNADRTVASLSAQRMVQGGLQRVAIYSNGGITLAAGSPLDLGAGGSFTAVGASVNIDRTVTAAGGAIAATTRIDLYGATATSGDIVVGTGATLATAGRWTNDSPVFTGAAGRAPDLLAPVVLDGGAIRLDALASVRLGADAVLDASAGAWVDSAGHRHLGAGGDISLRANVGANETRITGTVSFSDPPAGALRSFGLWTPGQPATPGGTLTIDAAQVRLGTATGAPPDALVLDPALLQAGGFSDYRITGQNALAVRTAAGSAPSDTPTLRPLMASRLLRTDALVSASGTPFASVATETVLPEFHRLPASLHLAATSPRYVTSGAGDLVLGAAEFIEVDAGGTVALSARVNLDVLGRISAPAGTITLQTAPGVVIGSGDDAIEGFIAGQRLFVGAGARLEARGFAAVYQELNALGLREGEVLRGGRITLVANKGAVQIAAGAILDVSGTSAIVDIEQPGAGLASITPTLVAGGAGAITVRAREGLDLRGTWRGQAVGEGDTPVAGAAAGTAVIGLDLYDRATNPNAEIQVGSSTVRYPTETRTLLVTDTRATADRVLGRTDTVRVQGAVDAATLTTGGFDRIELRSTDFLRFAGAVTLAPRASVVLDAAAYAADPGTTVTVRTAYAALGNANPGNQPGIAPSQQPVRTPVPGNAVLDVRAALVEWRGHATLGTAIETRTGTLSGGFASVRLDSTGDLRFGAARSADGNTLFTGSLRTTADVTLRGDRLYPASRVAFTLNPAGTGAGAYTAGRVVIEAGDGIGGVPLAAGGSLVLNGSDILQQGVLRAPLGEIVLDAAREVLLAANSVTSVSAEGRTIPFGSTLNDRDWIYRLDAGGNTVVVTAPPAGRITLDAPTVTTRTGATVDLSGGGDLYAYEFIAGPGGTRDVLNPASGVYFAAILPGAGAVAPRDPQYSLGTTVTPGDGLVLSGVPGLESGFHALAPARYALLPGAFAVRALPGYTDLAPGSVVPLPDGSWIVAAQTAVAGTDIMASRTSAYQIVPSAVVRTQSEFRDSTATAFFTARAGGDVPRLPIDAARLDLIASTAADLSATFRFDTASAQVRDAATGPLVTRRGRGGEIAIVASRIAVTANGESVPGALSLPAEVLNALGADTLVLGARRTASGSIETLTVGANAVELRNGGGVTLSAAEVVLAATGTVTLAEGSAITTRAGTASGATSLQVTGDGAVFRLAHGAAVPVVRSGLPASPAGTLVVRENVTLTGGSLALDAAGQVRVDPSVTPAVSALAVSTNRISLGDVPAGTPGLALEAALLDRLAGVGDWSLRSYGAIDLYGEVALGSAALRSLTLDASAIRGFGTGAKSVQAGMITFVSTSGSACAGTACTGSGTGALELAARDGFTFGTGARTVSGFSAVTVSVSAAPGIALSGAGSVAVDGSGPFTLAAGSVRLDAGAQQSFSHASGTFRVAGSAVSAPPAAGLGGRLTVSADTIEVAGRIDAPSGAITLTARNDLVLEEGALLRAAGEARSLAGETVATAGGSVALVSTAGTVRWNDGATVDVGGAMHSGGRVSRSGQLVVRAASGTFETGGTVIGAGSAGGADFESDVGTLGDAGALRAWMQQGDLTGVVSLRLRTGDFVVAAGSSWQAGSLTVSADTGRIEVAGTLSTRGASGGAVSLWARDDVTLLSGGAIDTRATGAGTGGGDVTLGTVAGRITLAAGAQIDTRAASGPAGDVLLRAPRVAGNTDLAIDPVAATVLGPERVVVEGTRVYTLTAAGGTATLGGTGSLAQGNLATDVPDAFGSGGSALYTDIRQFATAAAGTAARLAGASGLQVQVRPGIEVRTEGTLRVASALDLRATPVTVLTDEDGLQIGIERGADHWRVDGVPVQLTLRAGSDLVVAATVTDGFVTPVAPGERLALATGDSASFRLTAGADLSAASPTAVRTAVTTGHLIVTPGTASLADPSVIDPVVVRTGNGRIDLAASGDIRLGFDPVSGTYTRPGAQASVVYTAGRASAALPGFSAPTDRQGSPLPSAPEYPTDGGDVSLRAGRDIVAAPTTQLVTDWQWRQGAITPDGRIAETELGVPLNPSWWIAFDRFQQGVGALGGGRVDVRAGRDVTNLAVSIPTTGRVRGAPGSVPAASDLVVQGGGDLAVAAGGDIRSGVFQVDRGTLRLDAGGSVASGRVVAATNPASQDTRAVYSVLVLGDTQAEISARTGLTLQSVLNGTALPVAVGPAALSGATYFYTYSARAGVSLVSAAGDITLANDDAVLKATQPAGQVASFANGANLLVYPPVLSAVAPSGSVRVGPTRVFASPDAGVRLLASDDVRFAGPLQMYEFDTSRVAAPLRPTDSLAGVGTSAIPGRTPEIYLDTVALPPVASAADLPLAGSAPVRVVAAGGDIVGDSRQITLPKSAWFTAGGDITDLRYSGKNLLATDRTLFEAGGDLRFRVATDSASNRLVANNDGIRVGGPGGVTLLAGGDIEFGNSLGLVSRGNLDDIRLPAQGASLTLLAGLGRESSGTVRAPDWAQAEAGHFASATVRASFDEALRERARDEIAVELRRASPDLSVEAARARAAAAEGEVAARFARLRAEFDGLPVEDRVRALFFNELGLAALDGANGRGYARGQAAIDALFPGTVAYDGDINLFFSQVKTEQGGDIAFFTPGGSAIVGLPSPPAELVTLKRDFTVNPPLPAAANLGMLVTASGAIRGFARGDVTVNQSRVLTLQGGDILLWSTEGNIDAGRGAKTASAAPPPVIQTDARGNVFVNPSGAVSGSGIGQLVTVPAVIPGTVTLAAPRGEVNAGEAGVRSAGDLVVAALVVVGTDFAVGGVSVGVPKSDIGALSGTLSSAAGTTDGGRNTADQMARGIANATSEAKALGDAAKPTLLTVRLLCFGGECTPTFLKP